MHAADYQQSYEKQLPTRTDVYFCSSCFCRLFVRSFEESVHILTRIFTSKWVQQFSVNKIVKNFYTEFKREQKVKFPFSLWEFLDWIEHWSAQILNPFLWIIVEFFPILIFFQYQRILWIFKSRLFCKNNLQKCFLKTETLIIRNSDNYLDFYWACELNEKVKNSCDYLKILTGQAKVISTPKKNIFLKENKQFEQKKKIYSFKWFSLNFGVLCVQ